MKIKLYKTMIWCVLHARETWFLVLSKESS